MRCYECGEPANEKHHMIPKSLGGTKTIDLCSACHCKIHGFEGNRIKATELSKLGVYRNNPVSFVSVMAYDKFNQSNNWLVNGKQVFGKKMRDANYRTYQTFSGDYKLTQNQFENRFNTIIQWHWQRKYDWMHNIATSHYTLALLIGIKTICDRFKIKRYNHQYRVNLKHYNAGKMTECEGNDQYENYVLQNVYKNLEDKESRYVLKRQRARHELDFIAKLQEQEQERRDIKRAQRLFGFMMYGAFK